MVSVDKQEIQKIVNKYKEDWYYYYDFDGIEIRKNLKNDKTSGFYNWQKIKTVMQDLFYQIKNPCVFDIGCNMALYDHEMTKMGAKVIGLDRKEELEQALFYKKFIIENKKEQWNVNLVQGDIAFYNVCHEEVNIITLFCVIYHLRPNPEHVFRKFLSLFPNHRYVVIQGNIPRVKKKKQIIAGVPGMKEFLNKQGYHIFKIFEWQGYQKPIVIGERQT